jgi:hypothetical protein
MKRHFVVIAALLFTFGFSAFPAHAAGTSVQLTYLGGGVCLDTGVTIPIQYVVNAPTATTLTETAMVNGTLLFSINVPFPSGTTGASSGGTFGFASPQAFPYTLQDTISEGSEVLVRVTAVCNSLGAEPIVTIVGRGSSWDPGDDRLNRDPGQPAALYCRNGGDVQVWKVDAVTSRGTLALVITKVEIAKVRGSHPAVNTLIKASKDGKFKLYYLPGSDELSFITTYLNSNKPYTFVFKPCS